MSNTNNLSSAIAVKTYGMFPSTLKYIISNHTTIAHRLHDTLETYYILYWDVEYFLSQFTEGTIKRDNRIYHIIFKGTGAGNTKHRGHMIADVKQGMSYQVSLSFRKAKPEFNLPAYVLVSTERNLNNV